MSTRKQKYCQVFISSLQEQQKHWSIAKYLFHNRACEQNKKERLQNYSILTRIQGFWGKALKPRLMPKAESTIVELEGILNALVSIYRLPIAGESNNFQHKGMSKNTSMCIFARRYKIVLHWLQGQEHRMIGVCNKAMFLRFKYVELDEFPTRCRGIFEWCHVRTPHKSIAGKKPQKIDRRYE